LIEEPVHRQQRLVLVLAVGLPQVTGLDQPFDFRHWHRAAAAWYAPG
jgi:hypothetical protein